MNPDQPVFRIVPIPSEDSSPNLSKTPSQKPLSQEEPSTSAEALTPSPPLSKQSTKSLPKRRLKKKVRKKVTGKEKDSPPPPLSKQSTKSLPKQRAKKSPHSEGDPNKPAKPAEQKFFLVIATAGKNPRLEECSTTEEVSAALRKELSSSYSADIRAWLFQGNQLLIPAVESHVIDLGFVDTEGCTHKIYSSPDLDDSSLKTGIIVKSGSAEVSTASAPSTGEGFEFGDEDEDFLFE